MRTSLFSIFTFATVLFLASCTKTEKQPEPTDPAVAQREALEHFANGVALPMYSDLNTQAQALHASVTALCAQPTQAGLLEARSKWISLRAVWEKCEGFLIGPVDEGEYDPRMDTWPNDFAAMENLLAGSQPLDKAGLENLDYSLRGFHPIEYLLWGEGGNKQAADFTAREKEYLLGLADDLVGNTSGLYNAWLPGDGGYATIVTTAGENGNTTYTSRQQIYLALVDGLAGICEEVGEGKIEEPFVAQDSTLVESPYSGNSIQDFHDNMRGILIVYKGSYNGTSGRSLSSVVAASNASLDNKLQSQMIAAVNAFDNVTMRFEQAIFHQQVQLTQVQNTLATLKTTLETELRPWVLQHVQ